VTIIWPGQRQTTTAMYIVECPVTLCFPEEPVALAAAILALLNWAMVKHRVLLFLPTLALMWSGASAEVVDLSTRPEVTQRFLYLPAEQPRAAAILFVGGTGRLKLTQDGSTSSTNFLYRSRELFRKHGITVLLPDVPSDRANDREGLTSWRDSSEHALDIRALVQWARQRKHGPVFLVGTSRGTISAANGVARFQPPEGADAMVLSATVTGVSRRRPGNVYDVKLKRIQVPVLIVHHESDNCSVTPYSGAKKLQGKIKDARLISFTGGDPPQSEPCQALSPHGFLGIEDRVVGEIVQWMDMVISSLPRR